MRPARELVGDCVDERRVVGDALERSPSSRANARELARRRRAQPQNGWSGTGAIGLPEVEAVGVERGAERAAGVARRRRHEDALEARLAQDPRVGAAVQRDPAAEAEVGEPRLALQRARRSTSSSSSTRCTLAAMSA